MAVTIFRIRASEIRGKRWDSVYYISHSSAYFDNCSTTLKDYVVSIVNGLDSRQYVREGMPYLKVANIKENGISKKKLQYLPFGTVYKNKLQKGDLLVTRKGTFGVATVVTAEMEDMLISSEIFHIRLKTNINPYILAYYINTNTIQKELARQSIGAIMGSLTQEALLSTPMPNDFNQEIVDIMDNAYSEKKRLESEATELLNSIDSYVTDKLGIEQATQQKSTQKWFVVKASDVRGKRWGVVYNSVQTRDMTNWRELDSSLVQIFQGVGRNLVEESDSILLKVKNIMLDGTINFNDTEYINTDNINKVLQKNDILTPAIGESVKLFKFSLFNAPTAHKYLVDNNTAVIRCISKDLEPKFLVNLLKIKIVKEQVLRLCGGGGVPFIGSALVEIKIPLPPMNVQREIADECERRRFEAFTKKELAQEILFTAKAKVESMLFGEI